MKKPKAIAASAVAICLMTAGVAVGLDGTPDDEGEPIQVEDRVETKPLGCPTGGTIARAIYELGVLPPTQDHLADSLAEAAHNSLETLIGNEPVALDDLNLGLEYVRLVRESGESTGDYAVSLVTEQREVVWQLHLKEYSEGFGKTGVEYCTKVMQALDAGELEVLG